MKEEERLRGAARLNLIDALHQRYANSTSFWQRLVYWRKKYSWVLIVGGAKLLKRTIDIAVSFLLLLLLLPLFLLIALLIKLGDGGPVFYITNRVGKWGREFQFPKFRSMVVNADSIKKELQKQNDLGENITFKMKRDPRITRLGAWLRRTSLDELPQLWCVLKGDMSLVGPRPPLPEEVEQYHLEERKRLDITPGLTCIWQVSGRSDIPFPRQVKLDLQYIESQSFWGDVAILLKTIPAVIFGRGAY